MECNIVSDDDSLFNFQEFLMINKNSKVMNKQRNFTEFLPNLPDDQYDLYSSLSIANENISDSFVNFDDEVIDELININSNNNFNDDNVEKCEDINQHLKRFEMEHMENIKINQEESLFELRKNLNKLQKIVDECFDNEKNINCNTNQNIDIQNQIEICNGKFKNNEYFNGKVDIGLNENIFLCSDLSVINKQDKDNLYFDISDNNDGGTQYVELNIIEIPIQEETVAISKEYISNDSNDQQINQVDQFSEYSVISTILSNDAIIIDENSGEGINILNYYENVAQSINDDKTPAVKKDSDLPAYQCGICDKTFILKRSMLRHRREVHMIQPDNNYVCNICDDRFKVKRNLEKHKKLHLEINCTCDVCNKVFTIRKDMIQHRQQMHKVKLVKKKDHVCKYCNKIFDTKGNLDRHEATHSENKKFNCHLCGGAFAHKDYLNRHMKNSHKCEISPKNEALDLEPKFVCKLCDKSFTKRVYLTAHEKRHDKIEKFKCEHCDKIFINEYEKKKHQAKYETSKLEPMFICKFCDKSFIRKKNLTAHEKRHDKVKKFKCENCDKIFINKSGRKKHQASTECSREMEVKDSVQDD